MMEEVEVGGVVGNVFRGAFFLLLLPPRILLLSPPAPSAPQGVV